MMPMRDSGHPPHAAFPRFLAQRSENDHLVAVGTMNPLQLPTRAPVVMGRALVGVTRTDTLRWRVRGAASPAKAL